MTNPAISPDPLALSWRTNGQLNGVLLAHLTPDMLAAVTPGGGFTVAQHLAHMAFVTKFWTSLLDEGSVRDVPDLYDPENFDPESTSFVAETDLTRIRAVLSETSEAVLRAAEGERGLGKLPHANLHMFVTHLLVHDAHHRGQILLALKTAGHPLPHEDALWAPLRDAR